MIEIPSRSYVNLGALQSEFDIAKDVVEVFACLTGYKNLVAINLL